MKVTLLVLLFITFLFLVSCDSKNGDEQKRDSSQMVDSGIMNKQDTFDRGLDTSVIDTSSIHLK